MQACPQCQSLLESWEVFCHGCGRVISLEQVPIVNPVDGADEVEQAYNDWLNKGQEAVAREDFEAAAVCFQEALRRSTVLSGAREKEMEVRLKLAAALEGAKKLAEAAEQYKAVSQRSADEKQRKETADKAESLKDSTVEDIYRPAQNEFRAAEAFELKLVPLYCNSCKRLLTEGELYGFRKGLMEAPRCVCGFMGAPLVKRTVESAKIVRENELLKERKAKLIEAASVKIPGGKDQQVATILAITLGLFGAHKFYLGENAAGVISILFCWTFLPWLVALFEATQLASMSQVTFNLQYNVEKVLERMPPLVESNKNDNAVFSMEITDDPEDFIDDLSGTETAGSRRGDQAS
jgi:TM2 domain-containing membrane protein YozV